MEDFIARHGTDFELYRDGNKVGTVRGIISREAETKRRYVGFFPNTDVITKDILVSVDERLCIVETETEMLEEKPRQLKAFYKFSE